MANTNIIEKDLSISLCRVISMMMVVATHYFDLFDNILIFNIKIKSNYITEFCSLGVYFFFLISGILFGRKRIDNYKTWFIKRITRLFIPLYIYLFIYYFIFKNELSIFNFAIQLLNLQGLFNVVTYFPFVDGPWFFTVIMIDYFLVAIINMLKIDFKKYRTSTLACILIIIYILFKLVRINLFGLLIFIVGYIFSVKEYDKKSYKATSIMIAMIFGFLSRIISFILVRDNNIYEMLFVPFSTILISLSFIQFIRIIVNNYSFIKKAISSKVFQIIDSVSIYVYLVHGYFLQYGKYVSSFSILCGYAITLLFSIILSYFLYSLGSIIEKTIYKIK